MQPSPSGMEGQPSFPDGENTDVAVDEEAFYDVASELKRGRFLGMQFWQGEPVQLWMSEPATEGGETFVSVYMYRKDGTREVCIERIDEDTARMIDIRDSEGCCYTVSGKSDNKIIARLDSAGKVQYTVSLGGNLWDLCALADGRLALLTSKGNSTAGGYNLLLLDSEGKLITVFGSEKMARMPFLGVSEDGLLMLMGDYVYRVNPTDGKREQVYSFRQSAYTVQDTVGFSDIQDFLEVAKRYQYDARNNYQKITRKRSLDTINGLYYSFYTKAEEETDGYVPIGILFDDGRHPVQAMAQSMRRSLMLNANAANRDGAWEFVKFLLSEEAQAKLAETAISYMPVKKSVFEALINKEIADGPAKNLAKESMIFEPPLTRERADEIEAFLESARALPYKTEPILEIVQEESQEYFNGNKSIEQVADIIGNRVQLYLDEQRKK